MKSRHWLQPIPAALPICISGSGQPEDAPKARGDRPKRRWLRYILWTVLTLVMMLVAVITVTNWAYWYTGQMQRDKIKNEMVRAIEQSGGRVPSWQRDESGPLCWVCLTSDAGLEHLASLPDLRDFQAYTLGLEGPKVTDAGLAHLKAWSQLRSLTLRDTKITGAGLKHLRELPELRHLSFICSGVAAAPIDDLKAVRTLYNRRIFGKVESEASSR